MQITLGVQFAALGLMAFCAIGYRFSFLPFRLSFLLFLACGLVLIAVALFAALSMLKSPSALKLPQILIGLLPIATFFSLVGSGGLKVPRIHDIATRHEPPISFEIASLKRQPDENSLDPPGTEIRDLQSGYYRDLATLSLPLNPSDCFSVIENVVNDFGWVSIGSDSQKLWLEAYESTVLFGFKDDIRIEVSEGDSNQSCRVDARSVSRVGLSDLGVNAKRINRLFRALRAAI